LQDQLADEIGRAEASSSKEANISHVKENMEQHFKEKEQ